MLAYLPARLRWLLIRTPYRHVAKSLLRWRAGDVVRARREAFADIALDSDQQAVVRSLRRHGHADATAVVDRALLEAAYQAAQRKVREERLTETNRLNADKSFWERLLDEDRDDEGRHPSASPFVQLAIGERVLQTAAAYLEDAPLLDYIYLLHSVHKPGPHKVSQLWHRDYDDTRVLKLFVYFTDCETEDDGPFTFLPAEISRRVPFKLHSHNDDDSIGVKNLADHARALKGPKLSAFFVDTSRCYHMGSRVAPGHERLLFMGTYTTYPKLGGRPTNRFAINSAVSDSQRAALAYN